MEPERFVLDSYAVLAFLEGAAAHIKAQWSIAYADCFTVALAKLEDATIVTGDPEFRPLEAASVIPVVWLGVK
ncbi:MAG: hypothetical protein Q8O76_03970 [Chloroflexota bacterium]|nr:hypothetical protein [Chloroflexota bacterium]